MAHSQPCGSSGVCSHQRRKLSHAWCIIGQLMVNLAPSPNRPPILTDFSGPGTACDDRPAAYKCTKVDSGGLRVETGDNLPWSFCIRRHGVQMGRRQRSMYLHLKITSRHVLQGWPCESCSLTWSSLSMRGNMYKLSPQPNEALRRALFFKGAHLRRMPSSHPCTPEITPPSGHSHSTPCYPSHSAFCL